MSCNSLSLLNKTRSLPFYSPKDYTALPINPLRIPTFGILRAIINQGGKFPNMGTINIGQVASKGVHSSLPNKTIPPYISLQTPHQLLPKRIFF